MNDIRDRNIVIEGDRAALLAAIAAGHREPVFALVAWESRSLLQGDGVGGFVPARETLALADIALDAVEPGLVKLRPDIVEDRGGDALRRGDRDRHRHQSAQRRANEDRLGDAELVEQLEHVTGVGQRRVAGRQRVAVAFPTTAKIEHDDPEAR